MFMDIAKAALALAAGTLLAAVMGGTLARWGDSRPGHDGDDPETHVGARWIAGIASVAGLLGGAVGLVALRHRPRMGCAAAALLGSIPGAAASLDLGLLFWTWLGGPAAIAVLFLIVGLPGGASSGLAVAIAGRRPHGTA